jgi:NADPH-dependent 2,4-dienoyl-CoA reductase/sulfur reductase-like enzyme
MSSAIRVVIVGAGPAGIRAAEALVAAGLHPVVIDEGAAAGGQIYRRQPEGFQRTPKQLYGPEAAKANSLHHCFDSMVASGQLTHHSRSSVIALAHGKAHVLGPRGAHEIAYDRLILATGAVDRVMPVPGWQNGGVFSLGAAQIALKSQGVALGRQIVLAGSGPLLTLVASQLLKAGAGVAAVLDTAPISQQMSAAPGLLSRPLFAFRGLAMRLKLRTLYHSGVRLDRVEKGVDGLAAIHWRDSGGRLQSTPCDALALGWHLRAETHLADQAGCQFDYSTQSAQWLPSVDAMGRGTSGVYLAGDCMRILGADAAEISGKRAANACLQDIGLKPQATQRDLMRLKRLELFAAGLSRAFAWPSAALSNLPDDAVICRCEGITACDLRRAIALGGPEANRVKALSRVGMGRCQGRFCQLAAAEVIAAAGDTTVEDGGYFRMQAPARPVPVKVYLPKDGI